MRFLIYIVFIILYLIVTFFGLGPVLFADGSNQERIITFVIVLVIYLCLTIFLRFLIKKINRND
jgi:hypothetical protein